MSLYIIGIILFKEEVETCKEAIFTGLIFIMMTSFLLLEKRVRWAK
jgi:hypothetical protein